MEPENSFREELLALCRSIRMVQHPWFQGIVNRTFNQKQIIQGELQHYLRVRRNAEIFGAIVSNASRENDYPALEVALANYRDEVLGAKKHDDLLYQFLEAQGIDRALADSVEPTPGTMAAISMLLHGTKNMSALEGIALMSLPEYQNGGDNGVAAQVHKALTEWYRFSEYAAETFCVHAKEDVKHGERQISFLMERCSRDESLREKILRAARFGVVAFNYEWDGHYQAATGQLHTHWQGGLDASE